MYWYQFFYSFTVQFKQRAADKLFWSMIILQPLVITLLVLFIFYGQSPSESIKLSTIIGSSMVALITSIVQASAHSVNLERWLGTIDNIIATPASFLIVILGSVTAQIMLTYSSLIITYSSAFILFENVEPLYHYIPFLIAIILSLLSLISFGIFLAPLFTIGELTFWANSLQYPLYIICGAIIPLSVLPGFLQPIAFIFPPYWAGKILVNSTQMAFTWGSFFEIAFYLILVSTFYYLAAHFLFKKMLNYARKNASFQMF